MKIRIRGQSVRLRLGLSEVARLARGEAVEEAVTFGPAARFGCTLRPDADADAITHAYADGLLTVALPAARIDAWAVSDEVGIDTTLRLGNGLSLRLLIEKDFACIDGPAEESQADAFPNPSAKC